MAYCILLFDAHQADNKALERSMTLGLIQHFMPTLYPQQAQSQDTKLLKQEIAKTLALKWHSRPEIKESFVTDEDHVRFSLICKLPRHAAVTLITVEGKRLKPTRFHGYQSALEQLGDGSLNPPLPPPLTRKTQEPLAPLP